MPTILMKKLADLPTLYCLQAANSAVYLLLGTLPISAELHKRQLSLLHQIAMSENVSIREIAWRQYVGRPASFAYWAGWIHLRLVELAL
jgi:hypothetical protein